VVFVFLFLQIIAWRLSSWNSLEVRVERNVNSTHSLHHSSPTLHSTAEPSLASLLPRRLTPQPRSGDRKLPCNPISVYDRDTQYKRLPVLLPIVVNSPLSGCDAVMPSLRPTMKISSSPPVHSRAANALSQRIIYVTRRSFLLLPL